MRIFKSISLIIVCTLIHCGSYSQSPDHLYGVWSTDPEMEETLVYVVFHSEDNKVELTINGNTVEDVYSFDIDHTEGRYSLINFYSEEQYRERGDGSRETYKRRYSGLIEVQLENTEDKPREMLFDFNFEDQSAILNMMENGVYEMSEQAVKLQYVSK